MKFADLLQRMTVFNEKLEEQYGEVMTEDDDEILDLDNNIEWWVDYLAQRYTEAEAKASEARSLSAKYMARAKMFEKAANYRKEGLFVLVSLAGKTIKTAAATVFKSKAQASLKVDDGAVPDEYLRIIKEPDKVKIKDALKDGLEVNWAHMEPGKEYVVVKI